MIILPQVVAWARDYYGCPTMDGVPLEEDGGSGTASSHWEKFIAASEVMGPVEFPGATLSGLTLSLLESTGFYYIDWTKEETWDWGYKAGCAFINGDCNAHPRKCDQASSSKICSPDFTSKGSCVGGQHNSGCNYFESVPSDDCRYLHNKLDGDFEELKVLDPNGRCIPGVLGDAVTI